MAGAPWVMSYNSDEKHSREMGCIRKRSRSYLLVLQANAEWGQDIVAESVTAEQHLVMMLLAVVMAGARERKQMEPAVPPAGSSRSNHAGSASGLARAGKQ